MGIDLVASTRDEFSNKTEASSGYFALTTVLSRGGEWGRQTTRRRWRGALVVETGFIVRHNNRIHYMYFIYVGNRLLKYYWDLNKSSVIHIWFIRKTCKMSKKTVLISYKISKTLQKPSHWHIVKEWQNTCYTSYCITWCNMNVLPFSDLGYSLILKRRSMFINSIK